MNDNNDTSISLRDTIAIQVMLELLKNDLKDNNAVQPTYYANTAYSVADSMLARKRY